MVDARAPGEPSAAARQDGEWGTWEDARRRKITLGVDATPAERLAWLEAAIALAHASGALPRPERRGSRSANARTKAG